MLTQRFFFFFNHLTGIMCTRNIPNSHIILLNGIYRCDVQINMKFSVENGKYLKYHLFLRTIFCLEDSNILGQQCTIKSTSKEEMLLILSNLCSQIIKHILQNWQVPWSSSGPRYSQRVSSVCDQRWRNFHSVHTPTGSFSVKPAEHMMHNCYCFASIHFR